MNPKLLKADNIIFKTIRAVTAVLLLAMFIVIIMEVIFRYAFKSAPFWTEELARYIMFYMVLIGSSAAIRQKKHPALEFVIQNFNRRFRKCWDLLIDILIFFILIVILRQGYKMAVYEIIARTPALRISFFWVYLALPIGAVLMMVQIIAKYFFGLSNRDISSNKTPVTTEED